MMEIIEYYSTENKRLIEGMKIYENKRDEY